MTYRLPRHKPSDLNAEQRRVYDGITSGKRAQGPRRFALADDDGVLHGPFNAMVHLPQVGSALSRLGEAIRYETSLDDATRETVILAVAAHHRDEFEWYAHRAIASGLDRPDALLDAIAERSADDTHFDDDGEAAAYALAVATVAADGVPSATWDQAVATLGMDAAVEITATVGYYSMLSLMMRAHQVPLPDGASPTFSGEA